MPLLIAAVFLFLAAMLLVTAFIAVLPILVALFVLGFSIAFFAFWVWMLVDAIQNKGLDDGEKICWVLAIIFLHVVGAPLYFFIGRRRRNTLAHGSA